MPVFVRERSRRLIIQRGGSGLDGLGPFLRGRVLFCVCDNDRRFAESEDVIDRNMIKLSKGEQLRNFELALAVLIANICNHRDADNFSDIFLSVTMLKSEFFVFGHKYHPGHIISNMTQIRNIKNDMLQA